MQAPRGPRSAFVALLLCQAPRAVHPVQLDSLLNVLEEKLSSEAHAQRGGGSSKAALQHHACATIREIKKKTLQRPQHSHEANKETSTPKRPKTTSLEPRFEFWEGGKDRRKRVKCYAEGRNIYSASTTEVWRPCKYKEANQFTGTLVSSRTPSAEWTHLELGDVDDRDLGVELLVGGRVVVVVTLAVEADADAVRDRLDAVAPDGRVDGRVEEDLLGAHRLLSKGADSLDRRGSALYILAKERAAVMAVFGLRNKPGFRGERDFFPHRAQHRGADVKKNQRATQVIAARQRWAVGEGRGREGEKGGIVGAQ